MVSATSLTAAAGEHFVISGDIYLGTVYLFYSISHLSLTACANRYTVPRYPRK